MVLPFHNRVDTNTTEYQETDVAVNCMDMGKRVRMDESRARPTINEEDPMSPVTRYASTPHPSKKQKTASNDESQVDHEMISMIRNDGEYESSPAMMATSDSEKTPGAEDDPDWDVLTKQEPAKTDVAIFLAARDRRDQSDERFAAMLDEFHASFKASTDTLLQIAADIYDMHREKLDFMEGNIKQNMMWNEETRAHMEKTVAETSSTAQIAITGLLKRLSGVMNYKKA